MDEIFKVAAKSDPKSIAGAIADCVLKTRKVEVQAIGAGAVNRAIKGIAIARGFVAPNGIDLVMIPAFVDLIIDGEKRTAIRFIVGPR